MGNLVKNNSKIKMFEDVVKNHSSYCYNGMEIDVQSANAVLTVFNNLSDANKEKFVSLPVLKMIKLAWQLVDGK